MPERLGQAALALRLQGASYVDIAMTLGLESARNAMHAVTRELARDVAEEGPEKDQLRAEVSMQLDGLLTSVMAKARDDGHSEHIPAVRAAVTILDRKIRLHGLDAPTEQIIYTPTTTELENWVNQITAMAVPPQALEEADIIDIDDDDIDEEFIDYGPEDDEYHGDDE